MKLSKQDKLDIFETAMTWIVVLGMLVYGVAKIVQFNNGTIPDVKVSELTGMQLMWTFYGYSKPFVYILGAFEIVGGLLLLIKKTRLIGCIFTSTILINIILQDIFYGVHLGALKAALIYQLILIVILWLHKDKIMATVKILTQGVKIQQAKSKWFLKLALAFNVFAILRIIEYYITIKWSS